jgi:hypothetical protein
MLTARAIAIVAITIMAVGVLVGVDIADGEFFYCDTPSATNPSFITLVFFAAAGAKHDGLAGQTILVLPSVLLVIALLFRFTWLRTAVALAITAFVFSLVLHGLYTDTMQNCDRHGCEGCFGIFAIQLLSLPIALLFLFTSFPSEAP